MILMGEVVIGDGEVVVREWIEVVLSGLGRWLEACRVESAPRWRRKLIREGSLTEARLSQDG